MGKRAGPRAPHAPLTSTTKSPLVVVNFTRNTGGATAFSAAGFSNGLGRGAVGAAFVAASVFAGAAFVAASVFGGAAFGAALGAAGCAGACANIALAKRGRI